MHLNEAAQLLLRKAAQDEFAVRTLSEVPESAVKSGS